jgi:hypothetical protein
VRLIEGAECGRVTLLGLEDGVVHWAAAGARVITPWDAGRRCRVYVGVAPATNRLSCPLHDSFTPAGAY